MKRIVGAAAVFLLIPAISYGQWAVFDSSNLIQTRATASQLLQMSTRLAGMERLRIPPPLPVPVYSPVSVEQMIRIAIPPAAYRLMSSHALEINRASEIIFRTKAAIDNARYLDPSIARTVGDLEHIVTTPSAARGMSGILDSLAATGAINQRQAQTNGTLLSSLVEFQAMQAEKARDEALMLMQMRSSMATERTYTNADAWAHWRQP